LSTFIIENWRPHDIAAGKAQRKALVDEFDAEGWLRIARNKHFLHYPTLGDMEDTLRDPDIHWHVEIAHGKKSSNTFYPASDVFANYAWFRRVNGSEPMKGLREALDVLRRVAGLTLATLEQSIGYFVDRKLVSLGENELVS